MTSPSSSNLTVWLIAVGGTFVTVVNVMLVNPDNVLSPLSSTPLIDKKTFWEKVKSTVGSIFKTVLLESIVATNWIAVPFISLSLRTIKESTLLSLISELSTLRIDSLNISVILLFKEMSVELFVGENVTVGATRSLKFMLLLLWVAAAGFPAESKIEFESLGAIESVSKPFAVPDKFMNILIVDSPPTKLDAFGSVELSFFFKLIIEALVKVPSFFVKTKEKSDASNAPLPLKLLKTPTLNFTST